MKTNFLSGDDEKSNGIPHEGQAVPAPYPSYAPGRNRRELAKIICVGANLCVRP